jgi:hypothetical protein
MPIPAGCLIFAIGVLLHIIFKEYQEKQKVAPFLFNITLTVFT